MDAKETKWHAKNLKVMEKELTRVAKEAMKSSVITEDDLKKFMRTLDNKVNNRKMRPEDALQQVESEIVKLMKVNPSPAVLADDLSRYLLATYHVEGGGRQTISQRQVWIPLWQWLGRFEYEQFLSTYSKLQTPSDLTEGMSTRVEPPTSIAATLEAVGDFLEDPTEFEMLTPEQRKRRIAWRAHVPFVEEATSGGPHARYHNEYNPTPEQNDWFLSKVPKQYLAQNLTGTDDKAYEAAGGFRVVPTRNNLVVWQQRVPMIEESPDNQREGLLPARYQHQYAEAAGDYDGDVHLPTWMTDKPLEERKRTLREAEERIFSGRLVPRVVRMKSPRHSRKRVRFEDDDEMGDGDGVDAATFGDVFSKGLSYGRNLAKSAWSFINKPPDEYMEKTRNYLSQYGDKKIRRAWVTGEALPGALSHISNIIAPVNVDKLYHLAFNVELMDGDKFRIEKHESGPHIVRSPNESGVTYTEDVPLPHEHMTMNEIMQKTKNAMGPNFFPYDAFESNCQDFVLALLHANDLLTPRLVDKVKQFEVNTVAGTPLVRNTGIAKAMRLLTNLGNALKLREFGLLSSAGSFKGIRRSHYHPLLKEKIREV